MIDENEKKYRKKKNALIITFMVLLLIFVCLICYIVIYSKLHPPKEFVSPDTIEIKSLVVGEYEAVTPSPTYTEITESTEFIVKDNENKYSLTVENSKVIAKENEGEIKLILDDTDVNNNIKSVYQDNEYSLILTTNGKLYSVLNDSLLEENQLKVEQVQINTSVKSILKFPVNTDGLYVLTRNNKIVNIANFEEYDGVIRELTTPNGTIYVYDDYSFSFEIGKVFTNEAGERIKFNILFNDKLIAENAIMYDVNFQNKTITTSKLGKFVKIGYGRTPEGKYNINLEANTGYYKNIESEYYYTR